MNRPIKCYHTSTTEGEHQQLVFAESRAKAITISEAYEWEGDYINVRATRQPKYDIYAPAGYVPKEVLLEDGWWFDCYGDTEQGHRCCKQLTIEDNPIVVDNHVYCRNHAPYTHPHLLEVSNG